MKVVQINTVPHLSTGSVMSKNHQRYCAEGYESWCMWGRGRAANNAQEYKFATKLGVYCDVLLTRIDGRCGFHSKAATRRLLAKLDEIKPDVVHLHNIHGYYVNIESLFNWLACHDCEVRWTLHDCWPFTGHCTYFDAVACNDWKTGCSQGCCQINDYPKGGTQTAVVENYQRKKQLFTQLPPEKLSFICPSEWLAGVLKESFFAAYDVVVEHNSINTEIFKPTPNDLATQLGLEGKFIVLGVANIWTKEKGFDDFIRLRSVLDDSFALVMVGLTKQQIRALPKGILGVAKTESPSMLAQYYSAAQVFFNPTYQDNYPTVNLEAEACGTPVVCYNVGGCRETIQLEESCVVDSFDRAVQVIKKRATTQMYIQAEKGSVLAHG